MEPTSQVRDLFLLAIPIACVSWTITHEEIFKEPRDFCIRQYKSARSVLRRKFFYPFSCEYCFSHYVTIFFLVLADYHLLFDDWRGYVIGGFALVWIANLYMSLFQLLRVGMKKEKMDADIEEIKLNEIKSLHEG
jgi:hypothetical protein